MRENQKGWMLLDSELNRASTVFPEYYLAADEAVEYARATGEKFYIVEFVTKVEPAIAPVQFTALR
jgi:hypothetical protein